VKLLPNPTGGSLNISATLVAPNLSVMIYDNLGSELLSYSESFAYPLFSQHFDISSLSNGVYLVKIRSGDDFALKRLLVAK
jgi:hypothetical protein